MADTNFELYLRKYIDSGFIDNSKVDDDNGNILNDYLTKVIDNCKYYDIDDLLTFKPGEHNYKHTIIHINIHSLPSW